MCFPHRRKFLWTHRPYVLASKFSPLLRFHFTFCLCPSIFPRHVLSTTLRKATTRISKLNMDTIDYTNLINYLLIALIFLALVLGLAMMIAREARKAFDNQEQEEVRGEWRTTITRPSELGEPVDPESENILMQHDNQNLYGSIEV